MSTKRATGTVICLLALVMTLIIFTVQSAPADDDTLVTLDVSPKTVKVGDIITLNIFIKHKKGFSLYLPDSIDITPFDIVDTKLEGMKKEGGTFSHAIFKISVYKTGIFSIPNINLLLRSDQERIEISTPERKLEVVSTLKKNGNTLKDIFPPIDIRQSYLKFLIYVWIISLVLIIFTILHFKKKKKQERLAAERAKPKPKRDPKKVANELLDRIFSHDNIVNMDDKEICENISFTIKYFLMERFNIGAIEMTSYELINILEDMGLEKEYLTTLYKLLMKCDLVKFANRHLVRNDSHNDIERMKDSAMILVEALP